MIYFNSNVVNVKINDNIYIIIFLIFIFLIFNIYVDYIK